MDLILLPMLMRALMGEGAKELRSELPDFVRERVSFFLAPCEDGLGAVKRGSLAATASGADSISAKLGAFATLIAMRSPRRLFAHLERVVSNTTRSGHL